MHTQSQNDVDPTAWEFTLTREPVNPVEQACFADDLARLGLDEIAWLVLNGTTMTSTPTSIPKVLRGYRAGRLAGVAVVMECRAVGQSLFAQSRMAKLIDALALPIPIWLRQGALTDAGANPGFVAAGVERSDFVAEAARFLRRTYLLGGILEGIDERTAGEYAAFPFCAYGVVEVEGKQSVDELYADSKNLRRKVNKFRNKGGEIELIRGALAPELSDTVIRCMNSVKAVLISPFQDNYNNMVLRASSHASERIVHFIARLQGECVGYHSFAQSGKSLHCLSGAFDRTRHSTYHAYENLILANINYCLEQGLHSIHYGMVVNETKAKMMSRFIPIEQRYFVRFSALNVLARKFLSMTRLTSPEITAYATLAADAPTASDA